MPAEEGMKKNTFISLSLISLFILSTFTGCSKKTEITKNEVTVYTYDSFITEWGPGAEIARLFEEKTGYKVNYVDCGDAVQVLSKAILEKDNSSYDILLGLDNNLAFKAKDAGILKSYKPENADSIIDASLEEELGGDWLLTPYDYSHFAMIFNSESKVACPTSLKDLTNPIYQKKIILMDPRTSTPGLGFLSWTVAEFGDGKELEEYWSALKPNILTMTSGWSEGWGMYQDGEAPLVISYTTSPAYNVEYDENYRDVAQVFEKGHVMQVEGAGLSKNAPNEKGAKAFLDFLITEEAQNVLPLTQWMYPANSKTVVPESYNKAAPIPSVTLKTDAKKTEAVLEKIMSIIGK